MCGIAGAFHYKSNMPVSQNSLEKMSGEMTHRGTKIDPSKIKRTALMTVEGENDDISGVGQTQAAHTLCSSLPDTSRVHYMQPGIGHYGVFNGSRFRSEIAPRISKFILAQTRKETIVKRAVRAVRKS